MSPRRSHRRARRRSRARPVLFAVVAVVAVVLVIGGLTQVSSQSHTYDSDSNRALAAQGAVVAAQSNATAAVARRLIADLPTQSRQTVQAELDGVVRQASDESARAAMAASDAPEGSLAAQFSQVFVERAQAMDALQTTVDAYLGMSPVAPAGSPAALTASVAPSTSSLSATGASSRIAAAGALLGRSDAGYRSVRAELARAMGDARLPASVWLSDPQQWSAGAVAATVDLMATSSTLGATHNLVIRTVRLDPPALPPPLNAPSGISVVSPGTRLGVSVVLANEGSVGEAHATAHISLVDQATGATDTRTSSTPIALGREVALPEVTFGVKAGTTYLLNVSVLVPPGQTSLVGTATQYTVEVAPGT